MRKIKTKIYIPTTLTGNMGRHYIPVLEDLRKQYTATEYYQGLQIAAILLSTVQLGIRLLNIKTRGLA